MQPDGCKHLSITVPDAAGALAVFSILPDCTTPQAVT